MFVTPLSFNEPLLFPHQVALGGEGGPPAPRIVSASPTKSRPSSPPENGEKRGWRLVAAKFNTEPAHGKVSSEGWKFKVKLKTERLFRLLRAHPLLRAVAARPFPGFCPGWIQAAGRLVPATPPLRPHLPAVQVYSKPFFKREKGGNTLTSQWVHLHDCRETEK